MTYVPETQSAASMMDHTPSAEFRDFLEYEITRDFKRAPRRRNWRGASIVLMSVALGSTAGLAAAQRQDSSRRDSLLSTANADLAIVALRLDFARAALADAQKKVNSGALPADALAAFTNDLRAVERQAMRLQLNIEETRASSQSPRDEINAPKIGDRDFVLDRMKLDALDAQEKMKAAEQAMQEAERRVRVGAADALSQREASLEFSRSRARLYLLAERLSLRKEFLMKGSDAEMLQRKLRESEVRMDATVAADELRLAEARLEMTRKRQAAGAVDQLDVLRAELAMREQQVTVQRLVLQLQAMERDKKKP